MDVRVVRVVQHDGPDVADPGPHARLAQLAHVAREVRARRPRQQRPVGVEGRDQGLRRLQERLRVDAGERAAPLRAAERLRAAQEGRRRLVVLPVDRRAGRVEAAQQHCDYCDARDDEPRRRGAVLPVLPFLWLPFVAPLPCFAAGDPFVRRRTAAAVGAPPAMW